VPTEDTEATSDGFVPTRRVREAPGGTQRLKLFEEEFPDDALAKAPSHDAPKEEVRPSSIPPCEWTADHFGSSPWRLQTAMSGAKSSKAIFLALSLPGMCIPPQGASRPSDAPSRRVRDNPGGKSEIGTSLFG
jgi:hypothetical protein